jgi:hypothetical protein
MQYAWLRNINVFGMNVEPSGCAVHVTKQKAVPNTVPIPVAPGGRAEILLLCISRHFLFPIGSKEDTNGPSFRSEGGFLNLVGKRLHSSEVPTR